MMYPLIDADVLRYECGFGVESGWPHEGYPPADYAFEMLDNKIGNICAMVGATLPPTLFLTGKGNFRESIAKLRPYKQRQPNKPFHFKNLTAYMLFKYDVIVSEGMEADDLMAITQTENSAEKDYKTIPTVICTRDKDLRQVPGWHYGWENHLQPEFSLAKVDELGFIKLTTKERVKADGKVEKTNKLTGVGYIFFLSQVLMGDGVDTVPGLPNCGPVKAFEILNGSASIQEGIERVVGAYKAVYGAEYKDYLVEQARLVWMVRKLDGNGQPIMWELPHGLGW
jgi:hypothetical protein